MGVAYFKKAQSLQMDSQSCTRFSGQVGHERKNSWLTVQANLQKGAWQREGPVTKRCITSICTHVRWPNFANSHTQTLSLGLPRPYISAPPNSITHQLLFVDCWLPLLRILACYIIIQSTVIVVVAPRSERFLNFIMLEVFESVPSFALQHG